MQNRRPCRKSISAKKWNKIGFPETPIPLGIDDRSIGQSGATARPGERLG
jgi:hypothetical protein